MTTVSTLTIIVDDNMVAVNGIPQTVDCSELTGVHAVLWSGNSGTVEYSLVDGVKKPPATFTDLAQYQSYIDAWTVANTPPAPLPVNLPVYAAAKQAKIASGGISVNVGTQQSPQNVEASTDGASLVLLQGAYSLAQANANQTFQWVQPNGVPLTLTAAQIITIFNAVTVFIQDTFNTLAGVMSAIQGGTITTTAGVDSPPSPIPAWPANS